MRCDTRPAGLPFGMSHPSDPLDLERLVDSQTAAALIGRAEQTLRIDRINGTGPRYFKIGRAVKYRLGDLLDWRESRAVEPRRRPSAA